MKQRPLFARFNCTCDICGCSLSRSPATLKRLEAGDLLIVCSSSACRRDLLATRRSQAAFRVAWYGDR